MCKEKITLEHVSFTYGKGTPFEKKGLDDVSLSFKAGKITGLIGHTGSGKSTLVHLLNGLYRPDSGRVLLDGKDIWEDPKKIGDVRFRVGLVMQYPEYQLFDETVRSDIGFGPRNQGKTAEETEAAVRDAAAFAGIGEEMLDKSPFELSGGQKRRVAIAGVLAMEPEVLVLDEPAAGLDPRGRKQILKGLSAYAEKKHSTVILVSHSMEDMAEYCDDVAVMHRSRLYMQGSVHEVFSRSSELLGVGLNVPEVARIADRLRAAGIPLSGELYTVDGVKEAILRALSEREVSE